MSSRSMILDENAENNVLTFTYSKEARYNIPSITLTHRLASQIHSDDVISGQILNLQNVSARRINGYTLR